MTHTRYAFVKAQWHADIVDRALEGFCELIPASQVDVFDVPGAFESRCWRAIWRRRDAMAPSRLRHSWSTGVSTVMISWRRPWWTG